MENNLTQITAQDLAVLQNNFLNLLISGELTFEQINWFIPLSQSEKERLMKNSRLLCDDIEDEHLEWFVSLTKEKKDQLLKILPQVKNEIEPEAVTVSDVKNKVAPVVDLKEFVAKIKAPNKTILPLIVRDTDILRLISGHEKLIVSAFDFKETKLTNTDIFGALFFDSCVHLKSNKTPDSSKSRTEVLVYELARDATFSEIFGSIGVGLTRLCFKAEQIRNFCLKHAAWLNPNGFPTFFLLRDDNEYFVIRVLLDVEDSTLKILEEPLECTTIWSASEYRHIVVPDLNNQEF